MIAIRTISTLTLAALVAGSVPRSSASELSEIRDTQKKILERLDSQDKVLKDMRDQMQRLQAGGGGGRPQMDPNKVYDIAVGKSPIRGPKNAPVTLVEFADFQCPFCAQANALVDQVLEAYPKEVRFVYKQFPLEQIHPNALNASKAALAAANQGKYWEMHDELYKISRNLSLDEIHKKAESLGLDVKKFDADLAAPETEKAVREDLATGRSADVTGTPTMFLNGKRVMNRTLDGIKALVDEELKKKKG